MMIEADHDPDELDAVLAALANRHRREIVYALGLRPHTIKELADMRELSLPAIHKHVTTLEDAGLVFRRKVGRSNVLALRRSALLGLQNWLAQYHAYWGSEQESLENYARYLGDTDPNIPDPNIKEQP